MHQTLFGACDKHKTWLSKESYSDLKLAFLAGRTDDEDDVHCSLLIIF